MALGWNLYLSTVTLLAVTAVYTITGRAEGGHIRGRAGRRDLGTGRGGERSCGDSRKGWRRETSRRRGREKTAPERERENEELMMETDRDTGSKESAEEKTGRQCNRERGDI